MMGSNRMETISPDVVDTLKSCYNHYRHVTLPWSIFAQCMQFQRAVCTFECCFEEWVGLVISKDLSCCMGDCHLAVQTASVVYASCLCR